jgi:hypothetical protein
MVFITAGQTNMAGPGFPHLIIAYKAKPSASRGWFTE